MIAQKFLHASLIITSILLGTLNAGAQLRIERKIIIDKGQYYFFTVDDETQLATLYTGALDEKLIRAKKYPMPIGRELNDVFNPLSFDINDGKLVGINWILNSMNSRYEAIKKINIRDWLKPHPEWTIEDWAQVSFDQPLLVPNEPWERMIEENNVLENCFFDIMQIEAKVMAICNQGKLRIWHSAGGRWVKKSTAIPVDFISYFSLASIKSGTICLVDAFGNVYKINDAETAITKVRTSVNPKPQILIVDNDHFKTYTIAAETIEAATMDNLKSIIKLATEITF